MKPSTDLFRDLTERDLKPGANKIRRKQLLESPTLSWTLSKLEKILGVFKVEDPHSKSAMMFTCI